MFQPIRAASAQASSGSIRGVVLDADFDAPLAAAEVLVVEGGRKVETTDQGLFVVSGLAPGRYTVTFAKEGYVREVKADVVVAAGELTEIDVSLGGDFTEMEEFVVQDVLPMEPGSEAALLELRMDSPALMDSISADVMSRAGASDAANALTLVSGAAVRDGKFAVVRGLPDRYVSSQLNGFRVPSADDDTRAVELDQFPSPVIESIQVSKTFTPDQQGDASGGAVDVRLRGIPVRMVLELKSQLGYTTDLTGRDDFLSYEGGGIDGLGRDADERRPQPEGESWDGAVGPTRVDAPLDHKWSAAAGGSLDLDSGVRVGGFASVFYERDSSFQEGFDDSLWVTSPGDAPSPETGGDGGPDGGHFHTSLFDVERSSESVQWGGLGALGVETENHFLGLAYLYTHSAEDTAILAEDTRGKEHYFPGHDPDDPSTPGHDQPDAAPYLRTETLEYNERTTKSLQLNGRHTLPGPGVEIGDALTLLPARFEWGVASSSASLDQPDKRLFGSAWYPGREPIPGLILPPVHRPFKPAANFTLGNLQRTFQSIEEDSEQFYVDYTLPFERWTGNEGYLKAGYFDDRVDRTFDQESFSNFGDNSSFEGDFEERWSERFSDEDHSITGALTDVDYRGRQDVSAWYLMADVPLTSKVSVIGGARLESTGMSVVNDPEEEARWLPPGAVTDVALGPGDADVDFERDDVLPAAGLVYRATDRFTVRTTYSETVARQTFKELSPILHQEFLGGPVFVGNPELEMAELKNYDLRLDFVPYEGGLMSLSWFYKDLEKPIESVQRVAPFTFTTPVNYPSGRLRGFELELRQDAGRLWRPLGGLSLGANATFIDSEVILPAEEQAQFDQPNIQAPMSSRDATNAPEYLYNLYLTYDLESIATELALFYTVKGDTLVAGAAESDGNFVPSIYETRSGTLNLSVSRSFSDHVSLKFQAKNLLNPKIETVYRSEYLPNGDVTNTSFRRGVEFTLGLSVSF